MIQNMGRSARAAMLQRAQIAANQRAWLDYAYARDAGAFYGDPYGGDSSGEHLIGQTNPYAKYYAAQQAKQLAFQRARFLNAQKFQNDYMLQQQRAQDLQAKEERQIEQTKQEMERRLSIINREIDALENNPEVDKNSAEYRNSRQKLLDDRYEVETGLERNTLLVHEKPSGYKDENGDPIMSTFMIGPDDKPIFISEGKEVAGLNQKRAELEQKTRNDSAKLNLDKEKADRSAKEFDLMLPIKRAEVANARNKNEIDSAKQAKDDKKRTFAIADELEQRNAEKRAAQKERLARERDEAILAAGDDEEAFDAAMKKYNDGLDALDFGPATPEDPEGEYRSHRPTGAETRDEIERRNILTDPEATEEDLSKQVQYEGPMDPEFSDEQFAGTEPAGLYDPTGQPLSMDGGMYDGLI